MSEKKVYLCVDEDGQYSEGKDLKQAYENYRDSTGNEYLPEDLQFYEAVKVEVEVKIQKKEVVTKITAK